jgi:hypothetical protein
LFDADRFTIDWGALVGPFSVETLQGTRMWRKAAQVDRGRYKGWGGTLVDIAALSFEGIDIAG